MWPKFSRQSVSAVVAATEIAQQKGGAGVDTEHLLLGVLSQADTIASQILERLGLRFEQVEAEVHKIISLESPYEVPVEGILLTSQSKKALSLSNKIAQQAAQEYVGTEHLLLGLIEEKEGFAYQVLTKLGVSGEGVRAELLKFENGQ